MTASSQKTRPPSADEALHSKLGAVKVDEQDEGAGIEAMPKIVNIGDYLNRGFWQKQLGTPTKVVVVVDLIDDAFRELRQLMLRHKTEAKVLRAFSDFVIGVDSLCGKYKPLFVFPSVEKSDLPKPLVPRLAEGCIFTRKSSGAVPPAMIDALKSLRLKELHVCGAYAETVLIETVRELAKLKLAKSIQVEVNSILFEYPDPKTVEKFAYDVEATGATLERNSEIPGLPQGT